MTSKKTEDTGGEQPPSACLTSSRKRNRRCRSRSFPLIRDRRSRERREEEGAVEGDAALAHGQGT